MSDDEEERGEKTPAEQFYDDEIAPSLLALARTCQTAGVPFLAAVEYNPGDVGETRTLVDQSDTMLLLWLAQRAKGNIDQLAISWARHVIEKGRAHNSIVLKHLGVALSPADR